MKHLLLGLALMIGATSYAAVDAVRVNLINNESMLFRFADSPEIAFSPESFKITTTDANPVTFEIPNVESIDFVSTSDIKSVSKDNIQISRNVSHLLLSNLPEEIKIEVYSLNGTLLHSEKASMAASIDISGFPKGVCILKVGTFTAKLIL